MTVRFKLTMSAIAVILVANALLSFITVEYVGREWLSEIQTRVRLDLNSARAAYDSRIDRITAFLQAVAIDGQLAEAAAAGDFASVRGLLGRAHKAGEMDFLDLLDDRGRVVCRARNPERVGDDVADNLLVQQVFQQKKYAQGTLVLSAEELSAEGAGLPERARFELLPTPAAAPTSDVERTEGMVIASAMPVFDEQGNILAVLYGGSLLNRRYGIVDQIKKQVFPPQFYEGRDIGTVTIFQGDLRISTNVKREDGSRAVGTRLSSVVYDAVLQRGGTWADLAFVVNDWYITAYEPIRNPDNQVIGALYVGLLRAPLVHRRNVLTWTFLAIALVTTLGSLVLIHFVTVLVLRPISRITAMSRRVVEGDLSARVGVRPPGEMGELCESIDRMAAAIAEREERLARNVERQIGRSEQLASIGRLAAGVAHEINNPLTGVLTFAHLLRQKGNMDAQDREDLDLIIRETTRAAEIVSGLLNFARERPPNKEPLNINEIVDRTLRLLGNQKAFQQIVVVEDLADDLPLVDGDVNQLQQVLLNLALNACEAMTDGGTLLISTAARDGRVVVTVTDTGCGISREHLDKIFEPFFSTKPVGKGTGLGLSVSYGIVNEHGGSLEVESKEGVGTTFTIVLPVVGNDEG